MNTPWKRIEAVIVYHGFKSVSAFSRHIGLRRPENLYQIRRGNNGISPRLAETIACHFPEVSRAWLLTGEGHMLLDGCVRVVRVVRRTRPGERRGMRVARRRSET